MFGNFYFRLHFKALYPTFYPTKFHKIIIIIKNISCYFKLRKLRPDNCVLVVEESFFWDNSFQLVHKSHWTMYYIELINDPIAAALEWMTHWFNYLVWVNLSELVMFYSKSAKNQERFDSQLESVKGINWWCEK